MARLNYVSAAYDSPIMGVYAAHWVNRARLYLWKGKLRFDDRWMTEVSNSTYLGG